MVKIVTKTVVAALILMLCGSALFAQMERPDYKKSKSEVMKQIVQKKSSFINDDRNVQFTNPNSLLLGNSRGVTVEAWRLGPAPFGYYVFNSDNANGGEVIWDPGFDMMAGETVDGLLYAYDDETNFYIWDVETGEMVDFFAYAVFDEDYIPNEVAYDYSKGIMYGLSWNELLIVDMETGEVEVLDIYFESENGDALVFMAFAIDSKGNAYGVTDYWDWDIWTYEGGILFSMDLETGICTRIGDTGIQEMWYYPEGMAFDNNTGKLYWSHLGRMANNDYSWREIDVETGLSTRISDGAVLVCIIVPFDFEPEVCDPVTNLEVEYNADCEAVLTWDAPEGAELFNVYRDGEFVAEVDETTFTDVDFDETVGHYWSVTVVCGEEESEEAVEELSECPFVGISKVSGKISIYPNPARNMVYVDGANIVKVEVYNMLGQLIDTQKGKVKSIDVSKYNSGTYLFKAYDVNNNAVITNITVTK